MYIQILPENRIGENRKYNNHSCHNYKYICMIKVSIVGIVDTEKHCV